MKFEFDIDSRDLKKLFKTAQDNSECPMNLQPSLARKSFPWAA